MCGVFFSLSPFHIFDLFVHNVVSCLFSADHEDLESEAKNKGLRIPNIKDLIDASKGGSEQVTKECSKLSRGRTIKQPQAAQASAVPPARLKKVCAPVFLDQVPVMCFHRKITPC